MEKYIGLMSGTSMDGVDAVLVEMDDKQIKLLGHHAFPMGKNLKQSLLDICLGQPTSLQIIGELDHRLGHLFADAVLALLDHTELQRQRSRRLVAMDRLCFTHRRVNTLLPCKLVMPILLQLKQALPPLQISVARIWL